MKKLCILGICSLLLISASCSDDKKAPSWEDGDNCKTSDMANDNGAECYKNKLYSCRNGRITIDVCNYDCNVTSNKAHCKGDTPIDNNVTQPGDNTRPGGTTPQRPGVNPQRPVAGASCDNSFDEYCAASGEEIAYCGNDGRVVFNPCDNGCMFDDLGMAVCIIDCGSVDKNGTCSGDMVSFCYSDGTNQTLIVSDCADQGLTCGRKSDKDGDYYDCVPRQNPPADNKCGDITEKGACAQDGKTVKYCNNGNIDSYTCVASCDIIDGFADCTCGDVTNQGVCQGNELVYCLESGRLERSECTDRCVEPQDSYADCYKPCGSVPRDGMCVDSKTLRFCSDTYGLVERRCLDNCTSNGGVSNCIGDRFE